MLAQFGAGLWLVLFGSRPSAARSARPALGHSPSDGDASPASRGIQLGPVLVCRVGCRLPIAGLATPSPPHGSTVHTDTAFESLATGARQRVDATAQRDNVALAALEARAKVVGRAQDRGHFADRPGELGDGRSGAYLGLYDATR